MGRSHMRQSAPIQRADVEVSFVGRGDGTTRLEIVHTGWDRLGAGASEWRDANRGGWGGLIPHFVAACAAT